MANKTLILYSSPKKPFGKIHFQNINITHQNAELNVELIDPQKRGGLFGIKLYIHALEYAFSKLNLHKVIGYISIENKAALKICQKLARKEGSIHPKIEIYALSSTEFAKLKAENSVIQRVVGR